MKRKLRFLSCFAFGAMLMFGMSACSNDDDNDALDEPEYKENMFEAAMIPYIDNTVGPHTKAWQTMPYSWQTHAMQ